MTDQRLFLEVARQQLRHAWETIETARPYAGNRGIVKRCLEQARSALGDARTSIKTATLMGAK